MNVPVLLSTRKLKVIGLFISVILLFSLLLGSVAFGIVQTGWSLLTQAFTSFNGSNEHLVIRDVRIPRALIGASVGASLGVAGTLLQALTKNPMADTGLFGINAGASFCIVIAITFFSVSSLMSFTWIAFLGAAASGIVVYVLGSVGRNGMTALKITLAGAAVTAMASSFTHGLLVINERALEEVLFWLTGSVEGRKLVMFWAVLPYMGTAWVFSFFIAGPVNTLMLGDDVATGLGQRTVLVKMVCGMLIVVLAGSSVAIAGPIAFVGLVIPHIARYLVGADLRWVVVYSGFLGAVLLLAADIGARFTAMPKEIPLGVMTAFIGVPFFIYVARRGLPAS